MATVYLAHDVSTAATSRSRCFTRISARPSAATVFSPRSEPPRACNTRTFCRCSTVETPVGSSTTSCRSSPARHCAHGSSARRSCRHLLYATRDGKLWSVPFDQNSLKTEGTPSLVSDGLPVTVVGVADFAVSASGTLVFSVDDASARRELVWVSRNGSRTPVDTAWRGTFSSPSLSPDGSRLAVAVRDSGASDVWIKPTNGGSAFKLTLESKSNEEAAWTPDGRSVTYISGASGTARVGDVVRQSVDGGDRAATLLHSERQISQQLWSPNGEWLVVRTTTGTAAASHRTGFDGVESCSISTCNRIWWRHRSWQDRRSRWRERGCSSPRRRQPRRSTVMSASRLIRALFG